MKLWREAKVQYKDPVHAWASIQADEFKRREYQKVRGQGGFVVWYGIGEWADYRASLADWPFPKPIQVAASEDRDQPATPDTGAYAPSRVKKGGRNQDLIRAAGWWMRQNPVLDAEWLVTALLGHTERWHDPPLTSAEVRQVAESPQRWHSEVEDLGGQALLQKDHHNRLQHSPGCAGDGGDQQEQHPGARPTDGLLFGGPHPSNGLSLHLALRPLRSTGLRQHPH